MVAAADNRAADGFDLLAQAEVARGEIHEPRAECYAHYGLGRDALGSQRTSFRRMKRSVEWSGKRRPIDSSATKYLANSLPASRCTSRADLQQAFLAYKRSARQVRAMPTMTRAYFYAFAAACAAQANQLSEATGWENAARTIANPSLGEPLMVSIELLGSHLHPESLSEAMQRATSVQSPNDTPAGATQPLCAMRSSHPRERRSGISKGRHHRGATRGRVSCRTRLPNLHRAIERCTSRPDKSRRIARSLECAGRRVSSRCGKGPSLTQT